MLEIYFGEDNGTPLWYSCLENPMDGGASWAAVHGVAKSQTRPSDFTFHFSLHALEKEMATHSSVLAWRIQGPGSLVGCHLWGRIELDMTEVTEQQQQRYMIYLWTVLNISNKLHFFNLSTLLTHLRDESLSYK